MSESMSLKTAAKRLRMTTEELHDLMRRQRFGFERNPKIVCPWDLIPITDVEMQFMRSRFGLRIAR